MAGVKGRSGGWRPGAGRKPGSKNPATVERETLITSLASELPALSQTVRDMLVHVDNERQMRRHQAEMLPTILRRLTEIEKHLALREAHRGPTVASTRMFKNTSSAAPPAAPNGGNNNTLTLANRPERAPKHAAAEALFKQNER